MVTFINRSNTEFYNLLWHIAKFGGQLTENALWSASPTERVTNLIDLQARKYFEISAIVFGHTVTGTICWTNHHL
jgi:hypothetical protein